MINSLTQKKLTSIVLIVWAIELQPQGQVTDKNTENTQW